MHHPRGHRLSRRCTCLGRHLPGLTPSRTHVHYLALNRFGRGRRHFGHGCSCLGYGGSHLGRGLARHNHTPRRRSGRRCRRGAGRMGWPCDRCFDRRGRCRCRSQRRSRPLERGRHRRGQRRGRRLDRGRRRRRRQHSSQACRRHHRHGRRHRHRGRAAQTGWCLSGLSSPRTSGMTGARHSLGGKRRGCRLERRRPRRRRACRCGLGRRRWHHVHGHLHGFIGLVHPGRARHQRRFDTILAGCWLRRRRFSLKVQPRLSSGPRRGGRPDRRRVRTRRSGRRYDGQNGRAGRGGHA